MKKILFFACLFSVLTVFPGMAQVGVVPYKNARATFYNGSAACSGCKLFTYTAGTTSNLTTYSDSAGTIANTDPIILDSTGSASVFLQTASCYKFALQTSAGVALWTQDSVCPDNQGVTYFAEQSDPTCVLNFDLMWGNSSTHRLKHCDNNGSADAILGAATTDTLTNKTFDTAGAGNVLKVNGTQLTAVTGTGSVVLNTSPTINGTPTGTGIPTLTLKKGSGGGNYTTASTTYVVADSTNLCYTVTIPTGWKLKADVAVSAGTLTAAVAFNVALTDNASCATANAGILVETGGAPLSAAASIGIPLSWIITGDGAAHNIALQYKTSNGADSAFILNSSSTSLPTMTFLLTPSN